ncbi:uncharacterized protein [Anabrus simplex]|uniref:uncharacterized protein n=1 Tax=Anabrus simplex TaxID=316456 RepID=UPI0035A2F9EE
MGPMVIEKAKKCVKDLGVAENVVYVVALSWDHVKTVTLQRCWGKLWRTADPTFDSTPHTVEEEQHPESVSELLDVVRSVTNNNSLDNVCEEELTEWIQMDNKEPIEQELTDEDITQSVLNPQPIHNLEESDSDEETVSAGQKPQRPYINSSLLLSMVSLRAVVLLTAVISHGNEAEIVLESQTEEISPNLEEVIGAMIENITKHYFSNSQCVGVITQTTSDQLMERISPHIAAYHVTVDSAQLEYLLQQALDDRCLAFVVRVEDSIALLTILAEISRRGIQRANRRYIILPVGTELSSSVLEMREMAYMPDLIEASVLPDGGIVVATHRYVGVTSWKDRVELDVWRYGAWERGADLYPDKLSNLQGRRFLFSTFNYLPYAVVDEEHHIYDGMEFRISEEFARKHNISWELSVDPINEWGEVYDNFTGNGILGDVVEDKTDLGFAALYMWYHEYQHLDFSYPYIRTGITCLAPQPTLLPGWMVPMLPFSASLWQAVGGSLVGSAVALYVVAKLSRTLLAFVHVGYSTPPVEKKPSNVKPTLPRNLKSGTRRYNTLMDCAFRTLGLLVLQTPDSERHEGREVGPTRHVLSWLLIVFVLVTSSYSSGLASVLAVPRYEPPIDTVDDLAKSGIHWAATHEAWIFSLREATDPIVRFLYLQFQVFKEDTLHRRSTTRDLAFSIERLPAGHFAVGDYIDEESMSTLRLMKQDIYWERSTTVARKGSPLIEPLNAVIHRLLDAGLMLVWEGQVSRRFLPQRVQVAVLTSNAAPSNHEPTKLNMGHSIDWSDAALHATVSSVTLLISTEQTHPTSTLVTFTSWFIPTVLIAHTTLKNHLVLSGHFEPDLRVHNKEQESFQGQMEIFLSTLLPLMTVAATDVQETVLTVREKAPEIFMGPQEIANSDGYSLETHTIQTPDGYLLEVHRIPGKGIPVFLQHGFLCASHLWMLQGKNSSLAYILADKGYDVWMGNARGNTYSKRHVNMDSKNRTFWNFGWHEMGLYDLSASIDHILNSTGYKKIFYVGHSMGNTMAYVLLSLKPEYNDKIHLFVNLAPAVMMGNTRSSIVRFIAPHSDMILYSSRSCGLPDVSRWCSFTTTVLGLSSRCIRLQQWLLQLGISSVSPQSSSGLTKIPFYLSHLTMGASSRTVRHFLQIIGSGSFRHMSYGPEVNMQMYGSLEPPEYNLSLVTVPSVLVHADGDIVVDSDLVICPLHCISSLTTGRALEAASENVSRARFSRNVTCFYLSHQ